MTEETTDYGPVAEGQVVNFPIGDLEHGNETYLIPFCKVNIAIFISLSTRYSAVSYFQIQNQNQSYLNPIKIFVNLIYAFDI